MPSRIDIEDISSAPVTEARLVPASRVIAELTGLRGYGPHMCPLPDHKHDSRSVPAFIVYPKMRGWWCFSCGRGGSSLEFVMLHKGMNTEEAAEFIVGGDGDAGDGFKAALGMLDGMREEERRKDKIAKLDYGRLNGELRICRGVIEATGRLDALSSSWLVSKDALKLAWHVGWNESERRYWLPVFNKDKVLVDVRRRSECGEIPKVKSMPVFGVGGHLFGASFLSGMPTSDVCVVGGEKDAVIGKHHLVDEVFVSGTTGEGSWNPETMSEPLRGRNVTVFYDDDATGRKGTKVVCDALKGVAREVRAVEWPVFDSVPGKDVADLVLAGRVDIADALIENARVVHADPLKGVRSGS